MLSSFFSEYPFFYFIFLVVIPNPFLTTDFHLLFLPFNSPSRCKKYPSARILWNPYVTRYRWNCEGHSISSLELWSYRYEEIWAKEDQISFRINLCVRSMKLTATRVPKHFTIMSVSKLVSWWYYGLPCHQPRWPDLLECYPEHR